MSQIFIWQSAGLLESEARSRIVDVLEKITDLHQGINGCKAFWEDVLFKAREANWKEWIDEAYIMDAIEKNNEKVL